MNLREQGACTLRLYGLVGGMLRRYLVRRLDEMYSKQEHVLKVPELYLFILFLVFLGLHHMEVPRLGG